MSFDRVFQDDDPEGKIVGDTIKIRTFPVIKYKKPMFFWVLKILNPKVKWGNVSIAFGDTVYLSNHDLHGSTLEHERVHCEQMRYSKIRGILHVIRYHISKEYRYKTEVEACARQYGWTIRHAQHPEEPNLVLDFCAKSLSGPFYGKMCTYEQVRRDIIKIWKTQS